MSQAMHPDKTIRSGDMRFAYHREGKPGQAVMLLHGWPQTSRAWPVDSALLDLGLRREVVAIVPGFLDALNIARFSDLIALVPRSCICDGEVKAPGLEGFDLPVPTPELAISAMWHPRLDVDPAHRWLRQNVMAACRALAQTIEHNRGERVV